MKTEDLIRVRHMLDAAQESLGFATGATRENLDSNRMLVLAVIKELEIIGEAASKLTPEFRSAYPHIPWSDIVGMRNRLTHGYFDIDLDRVWDTLQEDLRPLCQELESIIAKG